MTCNLCFYASDLPAECRPPVSRIPRTDCYFVKTSKNNQLHYRGGLMIEHTRNNVLIRHWMTQAHLLSMWVEFARFTPHQAVTKVGCKGTVNTITNILQDDIAGVRCRLN